MRMLWTLLFSAGLLLSGAARATEPASDPLGVLTERAQVHRVMLVGELHGTWEVPGIVAGLATNLSADERPLIVGLEIWRSEQAALDRYLASAGTAEDREALLAGPFWATRDGRSSEAMVDLIERLRVLALKAPVQLVAFDVRPTMWGGTPNQRPAMSSALASCSSMNWLSLLLRPIACHSRPSSKTATRCWLFPTWAASQLAFTRIAALSLRALPSVFLNTPPGCALLPKKREP